MFQVRNQFVLAAALILAGLAVAAEGPLYDEKADAHQQVAAAVADAAKTGRNVVLIYGANW